MSGCLEESASCPRCSRYEDKATRVTVDLEFHLVSLPATLGDPGRMTASRVVSPALLMSMCLKGTSQSCIYMSKLGSLGSLRLKVVVSCGCQYFQLGKQEKWLTWICLRRGVFTVR